jgi:hypothetical protein
LEPRPQLPSYNVCRTSGHDTTSAGEQGDKRLVVQLLFDDVWYDALIDTGSTKSLINHAVAKKHDLRTRRDKAFLTKNLFDDLTWRYMITALNPSEFNLQYKKDILKIEEKNRTWDKVEECVHGSNLPWSEEKGKFIISPMNLDFGHSESYRQLAQRILAERKVDPAECDGVILTRLTEVLLDTTYDGLPTPKRNRARILTRARVDHAVRTEVNMELSFEHQRFTKITASQERIKNPIETLAKKFKAAMLVSEVGGGLRDRAPMVWPHR